MRTPAGIISFRVALILSALLAAAAAAAVAVFLLQPDLAGELGRLAANPWWFAYQDPGSTPALSGVWRIAAAAAAAVIGILAALRAHNLFGKSASPLLPFLILFFFSLSLEGLRAATALLYAADGSIDASILLTRVMYWGRFVGLLGLLAAGLYCIDMKYRSFRILAGVVFLVSFAVAAYIPVDRTAFLAQMTWKLGDEQGVWFVNLMIGVLVLLTSAGGTLIRRDRRFLWLAGGMAFLLASREILFFAVNPIVLGAGLVCLAAGAVACLRVLAVVYRTSGE
jgi:hypothetical protein